MILPHKKDAIHKAWLYRLLSAIYDNRVLAEQLYFKGGTCAAMLGWLDRFSIDLDFDCKAKASARGGQGGGMRRVQKELESIFVDLGLEIKDKSKNAPQYFLRYPAEANARNTIKIDATMPPPKANVYHTALLGDIDRIVPCQTKETMFANKLVALIDRFEKHESIAGRDLYDIHHFFMKGFSYTKEVIVERRKTTVPVFLKELIDFVEKRITETIITQDLSALLPRDKFQKIRKVLKAETLMFLRDELRRTREAESQSGV